HSPLHTLPTRRSSDLDPRDEHRLELEPLRAVQREQVNAAALGAARAEPSLELGDEFARRAGAVVELRREPHETPEIGLAHELALDRKSTRLNSRHQII